jgi:hypothetical protein
VARWLRYPLARAVMLLACAPSLICLRVLRSCLRVHRPSSVCACRGAACVCTAPHLSARATMLLACAPRLICPRVPRCCLRVHRASSVCACCDAACVFTVPQQAQLSALAVVLLGVSSLSPWAGSQLVCELLRSACLTLTCRPGPTANGCHSRAALGQLNFKCENRREKKTPSQSEIVHREKRF